ncbi:hypothetical protein CBS63078_7499 [Aspergillus niger]|nr:hypothetical protein ASPNIDRAFT_40868 [Aspergillus niger ATCC 1015]KAI2898750.1 hypothetical protein CBS63078_7499 [Aspergillus niger]KAI3003590.1 hypothetical protein CBS147345_8045 [Aspergillus niger]KAI3068643.1 hypothetical protein CBS147353_7351 [Aspergillus niger]SPB45048.1 unnamed protein product [Aspergillus niger]
MKIVTDHRKTWKPTIGLQLFDARNPVGIYDPHMRAAIFHECLAWTHDLRDLPDPELLATAAPSRLGFLPRGEYLLRALRETFDAPDTPFWHAVAEQVYGFTWCPSDNTKLCHGCVHGSCRAGMLACFPDYLHFLGELAWQIYMARYQTGLLLDKLMPPRKDSPGVGVDPYGDAVLNAMNPMLKAVGRSAQPGNYSLRDRCQNPQRYDDLLQHCVLHFKECPRCRGYDAMTWQERVPAIGEVYENKYTDCSCMNLISAYMILTSPDRLWWLADPTAEYTGPQEEWSALLC